MSKDWANKLAKIMAGNENVSPIMFAKVLSLSPLSIEISGEKIEKFLFKTSSADNIKTGDEVIVVRRNNEFYILSKVIK